MALTESTDIDMLTHIKSGYKFLSLWQSPVAAIAWAMKASDSGIIRLLDTDNVHGWEMEITDRGRALLALAARRREVMLQ